MLRPTGTPSRRQLRRHARRAPPSAWSTRGLQATHAQHPPSALVPRLVDRLNYCTVIDVERHRRPSLFQLDGDWGCDGGGRPGLLPRSIGRRSLTRAARGAPGRWPLARRLVETPAIPSCALERVDATATIRGRLSRVLSPIRQHGALVAGHRLLPAIEPVRSRPVASRREHPPRRFPNSHASRPGHT